MKITILCDQTNCLYNKSGWIEDYSLISQITHSPQCTNKHPVFLTTKGERHCTSKGLKVTTRDLKEIDEANEEKKDETNH